MKCGSCEKMNGSFKYRTGDTGNASSNSMGIINFISHLSLFLFGLLKSYDQS